MRKLLKSAGYVLANKERDHEVWETDFATIYINKPDDIDGVTNSISFGHNENGYFDLEDVSDSEIRTFIELFSKVKFSGEYYGSDDPMDSLLRGMNYWFERVKELGKNKKNT